MLRGWGGVKKVKCLITFPSLELAGPKKQGVALLGFAFMFLN